RARGCRWQGVETLYNRLRDGLQVSAGSDGRINTTASSHERTDPRSPAQPDKTAGPPLLRYSGEAMCGIVGFLDKQTGHDRPLGRTLLAMLQALSCRGPDSAGVALYHAPQSFWIVQLKLPEHGDPDAAVNTALKALHEVTGVIRHQRVGAYL